MFNIAVISDTVTKPLGQAKLFNECTTGHRQIIGFKVFAFDFLGVYTNLAEM